MKKILILSLATLCASTSLHAGIGVQNTILCIRCCVPREQQWMDLTIEDFIHKLPSMSRSNKREVVTYCDKAGWFDKSSQWGWTVAANTYIKWQYIKNYYIITLQTPGREEEEIYATGDQQFRCPQCTMQEAPNTYFEWVSVETLYKRFNKENLDCSSVLRSPKFVDKKEAQDNIARIVGIIKVEEQDNKPNEFFDFTIDTKDNSYIIGKGHYWVKGYTR